MVLMISALEMVNCGRSRCCSGQLDPDIVGITGYGEGARGDQPVCGSEALIRVGPCQTARVRHLHTYMDAFSSWEASGTTDLPRRGRGRALESPGSLLQLVGRDTHRGCSRLARTQRNPSGQGPGSYAASTQDVVSQNFTLSRAHHAI
jgi:hypothetical protein